MGDGPREERVSWRLWAASGFSLVLIIGAYVIAKDAASPPSAEASEEEALLAAIASRDTDADGLADWAEALYGTDPRNRDTNNLGMPDGEAVARGLIIPKAIADVPGVPAAPGTVVDPDLPPAPAEGTLTAAFAHNLFTRYLSAAQLAGGTLSESDLTSISQQVFAELASSIKRAPNFKAASELTVSGSGAAAMRAFAMSAEKALKSHPTTATESELVYLKAALEKGDTAALAKIGERAKAYRTGAVALAALPVPRELAASNLALVNALARLAAITNDLALVEDDPLAAMLALQQYPETVVGVADAFEIIAVEYRTAGIIFAPGTPGASFVNLISDITAEQKAAAKKP